MRWKLWKWHDRDQKWTEHVITYEQARHAGILWWLRRNRKPMA